MTAKEVVDFIGIGVQKAGTTWLHSMLDAHPEIFVAKGKDKDTRFFSDYYAYGYEWYERHFKNGALASARGEISTSYFYSKDAPERVWRYNPRARLLLCLRNPLQRLISNHLHEVRLGRITGKNLLLENGIANNPTYVEQSLYCKQLLGWLQFFPLTSFRILIFEELFDDPAAGISGVYEFLQVDPHFRPRLLSQKLNESRVPRNYRLSAGIGSVLRLLRRAGMGWALDVAKKSSMRTAVDITRPQIQEYCQLGSDMKARLQHLFREENAKLAALIGRDLSIWDA